MTKEEIFELKKEIVILKDFVEQINDNSIDVEAIENGYKEEYAKLNDTDKKWINKNFTFWLNIYLLKQNKSNSCSSCINCKGC